MQRTKEELERIAYRIAGSAVVHLASGLEFMFLTIIPEEGAYGKVAPERLPEWFEEAFDEDPDEFDAIVGKYERVVEFAVVVMACGLASGVAEKICLGEAPRQTLDVNELNEVAGWMSRFAEGSEEARAELFGDSVSLAIECLEASENWKAVEAIAAALLEHEQLGYGEAKAIYESTTGREVELRWE